MVTSQHSVKRTHVHIMWLSQTAARYEVPNVERFHSSFINTINVD